MAKKKKNHVTPVAPCMWPFLNKPDTRFDKNGKYRVSLVFDQDAEFVGKVVSAAKKAMKKKLKAMKPKDAKEVTLYAPVQTEVDDDEKETGNVLVPFQTNAYFDDDGQIKPWKLRVFDAQGQLIEKLPNIGNGSKLAISFGIGNRVVKKDFFYTLYINAIQLIELVEFNADGSTYGFGKTEGGFETEDKPFDGETSTSDTDPDEDLDDEPDF